jgi:2OG-Fe(II) oxygenase superfamily
MREIINNFLPRNEFLSIRDQILNENFPWLLFNKNNHGETLCEERFNFQLVHIFYQSPTTISKYIDILNPLFSRINHQLLLRAKANITTCSEKIQVYGYHADVPDNLANISKTAIFYLNTNDGYTIFEDDQQKIHSLENRIVIFDSNQKHSGTNCTDQKYRAVINLNFI